MSNPKPGNLFKKGNSVAKGNDKSLRLSTWVNRVLDKQIKDLDSSNLDEYEQLMQARELLATKLVKKALKTKDDATFKAYFQEIADRTEGRPQQSVDVTSLGKAVGSMSVQEAADRLDELG